MKKAKKEQLKNQMKYGEPGHSDVSITINVYAHSTRAEKRSSARLLDKAASIN